MHKELAFNTFDHLSCITCIISELKTCKISKQYIPLDLNVQIDTV